MRSVLDRNNTVKVRESNLENNPCASIRFSSNVTQVTLIMLLSFPSFIFHFVDNDFLYKKGITDFVTWCKNNFLELNVGKTKEMIYDFRRANRKEPEKIVINGLEIERVIEYKYLGEIFDNDLYFSKNEKETIKKANSRLYCLYKLRSFKCKK